MSIDNDIRKLNICEEVPVKLVYNGEKLVTFMCTPQHLDELAVGYLFNRGLIGKSEDILVLSVCEDLRIINVNTEKEINRGQYDLAGVLTSGCGNGSLYRKDFLQKKRVKSGQKISIDNLKELAGSMYREMVIYKETGGVHCSTLANCKEILFLREDVGRHNAIDKVIGKGIIEEVDFSGKLILTTGRISSDMILKTIAAGIPIVVSRSIPSSLALEMAETSGITIVGRIMSTNPIVYTHSYRIYDNNKAMVFNEYN